MNNLGATLIKLVVLAGGAVAGALIVRWYDDANWNQARQRSQQDKTRYAQGLAALEEKPQP